MTGLFAAVFPTLAGRVDAAMRIRALESANERLVRENARLRQQVDRHEQYRRAARARLAVHAGGR